MFQLKHAAAMLALSLSLGLVGTAHAADAAACEKQAVDKNGKALAGAAKNSFMKKCTGGPAAAGGDDAAKACDAKAVDKNGKALAGAAKASSVKKCLSESK